MRKLTKIVFCILTLALLFSGCEKIKELTKTEEGDDGIFASIFKPKKIVDEKQQINFKDYLKAAEEGSSEAQFMVGEKYFNGDEVPRDYIEAIKWYTLAANAGECDAQYRLGRIYYRGIGVPKQITEAYAWVNLAAAQAHPDAITGRNKLEASMTVYEVKQGQERSHELHLEIERAKKK
jgi:hypothetical protein